MYTKIEDFRKTYDAEGKFSTGIMAALTDASLSQSECEGHRTLARMAWHIISTYPEMMSHTGLDFEGFDPKAPVPATADEICKAYVKVTQHMLEQIAANWNDDSLQTEDDLYGEQWKKGRTLAILIRHEVHHRGQMTVLMRQAGLKVPDMYGPAKEGWGAYGMEAPAV